MIKHKPRVDSSLRQFLDAFGARVLLAAFGIINVTVVTHTAGARVYGTFATATAFATLIGFFTDLGASSVVVREALTEISAGQNGSGNPRYAVRTYLQLRIALVGISATIGAAIAFTVFPPSSRDAALLALLLIVFCGPSVIQPLGPVFGSMKAYRRSVIVQGVATVILLAAASFAAEHPSAVLLVAALVTAAAIATCYAGWQMWSWVRGVGLKVDLRRMRVMLRSVGIIGIAGALTSIYYRIDGIILLHFAGQRAAGLYAAAYRLLDQAQIVPSVLLVPIMPLVTKQLEDRGLIEPATDRAVRRLSVLCGTGLILISVGTAPYVVQLLMGSEFRQTTGYFTWMSTIQAWSVVAFVSTAKAIAGRLEKRYALVAAFGVVLNVPINLVLIPRFGAWGAVAATLITEVGTVTAMYVAVRRTSNVSWGGTLGFLAIFGVAAALLGVSREHVGLDVQVVGAVVFVILGAANLAAATLVIRRDLPSAASEALAEAAAVQAGGDEASDVAPSNA